MRVAYLDCFAGVAGDMLLGALLGAGVPEEVLQGAARALGLGIELRVSAVDRAGITSRKVDVFEGGQPAEGEPRLSHVDLSHGHAHGRSLPEIQRLIGAARLEESVKTLALRAFALLAEAEARVHNVPVEQIHFHEVGAVDAIADIVCSAAGAVHLGVERWFCSAVNVGGGVVECAHGLFPVPAPAVAELLRGVPSYSAHLQKELTTPTGAALVRALEPAFGTQPVMSAEAIGYGAGTRNPAGFPNVVRLTVGELRTVEVSLPAAGPDSSQPTIKDNELPTETVAVLETALDDLSPQLLAYTAERLLAVGALDVMLTPVIMKKGRPGTLLTVIAEPVRVADLQALLLRETSTLGVRMRLDRRACLDRRHETVETPYGAVRMKLGLLGGEELNAAPEFEDCRAAAERHGAPLKLVQQAAIAAWIAMGRRA